jgi:hypothetical protein
VYESPSSYLSALDIPLPIDAMDLDESRVGTLECEIENHSNTLAEITGSLAEILSVVNRPPATTQDVNVPTSLAPTPPTTPQVNHAGHRLKPASPSEFNSDCAKGCAFLNSCDLYIRLAPTQFADDSAKIYWVLSYMKGDRTARFTDRTMRIAQSMGSLPYHSWAEFHNKFIHEFCPKNELQTAWTELETTKYFQGTRSVDEYVDEFRELVDRAKYTKGANIVLKFHHGLSNSIQNYIACLTFGRPSDNNPQEWYDAAILYDENHIANSAFQSIL